MSRGSTPRHAQTAGYFECLKCDQRVQGHSAFVQHRSVCGAGTGLDKCVGCQK